MNWYKGITRLYLVLWAMWLLVIGSFTALSDGPGAGIGWTVFAWLGLAIPSVLFAALHWILNGFRDSNPRR